MKALCIGVHVLDVLVRPVEAIPEGDGALVEKIRLTAAGSAGGTALVLARLGAEVRSAGAVGTDAAGDMLLALLEREGIDTSLLLRLQDTPTSAGVLAISPSGDRPAWHVIGANGAFGADDVDLDAVAAASHVHLGGPEFMGGEAAAKVPAHAREHGAVTSVDVLAPGDPGLLDWIATWWTPPAAATPSPPASCAASRSAATAGPPRSSAAPPPRSSPRASVPTPAPTTSPPVEALAA